MGCQMWIASLTKLWMGHQGGGWLIILINQFLFVSNKIFFYRSKKKRTWSKSVMNWEQFVKCIVVYFLSIVWELNFSLMHGHTVVIYAYTCIWECAYIFSLWHRKLELTFVQNNDYLNFSLVQIYPPEDWLAGSSLPSNYIPSIIQMLLDQLSPKNVR